MKVRDVILKLQELLLIPEVKRYPNIGPRTRAALEKLAASDLDSEWGVFIDKVGRDINKAGEDLIKHFEGLKTVRSDGRIQAYWDSLGSCWTIGWGHTGLQHNDGTVYKGRVITKEKAQELFLYDMNQFERRVETIIKVPLNDDQFSALVSFDFNTGGLTLEGGSHSTLTKKLNNRDYEGAAEQFLVWNKATVNGQKKVIAGLARRRQSEKRLFESKHPAIVQ